MDDTAAFVWAGQVLLGFVASRCDDLARITLVKHLIDS
jgi:hypothetical protein